MVPKKSKNDQFWKFFENIAKFGFPTALLARIDTPQATIKKFIFHGKGGHKRGLKGPKKAPKN